MVCMKSHFYSLTKLQKSSFVPRYLGIMPIKEMFRRCSGGVGIVIVELEVANRGIKLRDSLSAL